MSHIKKLISAKTGKISFRVHIRTNQKTITKTFKLKKDALSFSRTIEGNANIKDALTEPLLNRTFSDLLLIYPSEKSRLKYFNDYFGDLKLNQIKKSHIVFALDSLKLAPATINRYKNDFGSFSKWVNRQLDDTKWNPQQGIQRKTEPESRQDYLSHDQQKELLNQCKLVKGKLYLYVLTALSTGLRKGELNALQWRDIQWVDRVAVIRGEDEGAGKTGYREVPLSIRIMTELHKNRDISVKGKIFTQSFRKQWYKVRKLAGISDSFVFHSLRHTAA
ncbi:MAG: tyrosine-type recombinase/integrase, partial [gamma proteobacterium symbiont of Taylorina sp.]|nr:tyrosine-type recombinase/integrase [gamma proteobacterium symbiont of Taylorina sp.]